jgi:predicted adenine nucleotide alpha hydrolase (AANH) superfamily ATPase
LRIMSGGSEKPGLLLHSCCGPCSTVPLQRLQGRFQTVVFFYGPNIHPRGEYLLRLEGQRTVCERLGVELVEGPYRPADWGRAVRGYRELPEGSLRCESCYRLRMVATARLARERGLGFFAVTLTVSRHKNSKVLERIGREVARAEGVAYLAEDFKKQDGYNQSVRRSRELGLHRQDYCGCSLSLTEALERRRRREAASR